MLSESLARIFLLKLNYLSCLLIYSLLFLVVMYKIQLLFFDEIVCNAVIESVTGSNTCSLTIHFSNVGY